MVTHVKVWQRATIRLMKRLKENDTLCGSFMPIRFGSQQPWPAAVIMPYLPTDIIICPNKLQT